METQIICGNKYWLSNQTIGLAVSFKNLPEEIKVQGETFFFPTPFHVSLVYIGKIIQKYDISIPNFENKIVNDFCDFTKANNIEITSLSDEYRLVSRDGINKTVVIMCEVSNLNKFFDFLNKKYSLNVKYLPTHITLYNTIKGKSGIYLLDSDDLK